METVAKAFFVVGVALVGSVAGCTSAAPQICYGNPCDASSREPGDDLAEGGALQHDVAHRSGAAVKTWIQVYQFDGPAQSENAPFPTPTDPALGTCVDERTAAAATWPFRPLDGATFMDLAKTDVTGPGIAGTLSLPKVFSPNPESTWTFREYPFTYAATAPATPSASYTLDIGKGDPMSYFLPDDYVAPLGIGSTQKLDLDARTDLEMSWDGPVETDDYRKRAFDFVYFAAPDNTFAPQFLCFPDVAGHITIPRAVIDALPASGRLYHMRITHYRDAREGAFGELRRFDLVGSITNQSDYAITFAGQ